jgi:hypothetical protein
MRVQQGNYSLSPLVGSELRGKTVGIMGTGAIGVEACRIFKVWCGRGGWGWGAEPDSVEYSQSYATKPAARRRRGAFAAAREC